MRTSGHHCAALGGSQRAQPAAAAASGPHGPSATQHSIQRPRARAEPARCTTPAAPGPSSTSQPWHIGHYYTKKRERRVGPSGEIDRSPDVISEPVAWTPTAKLRLAMQVVAAELGLPEGDVRQRLDSLVNVVPGLLGSTHLKEADLVRLAVSGQEVAEKLLVLKGTFPRADVASMVARCPQLLHPSLDALRHSVARAHDVLAPATTNPSAVVAEVPMLARVEVLEACLEELQRLFGEGHDPLRLLSSNPSLAEMCQGLAHQARGDRDAEYLQDVYQAQ